jgi:hypothetical protein
MNADAYHTKEQELIAELANAVFQATNKQRISWEREPEAGANVLRVNLVGGFARLVRLPESPGPVRFVVYSVTDEDNPIGAVGSSAAGLRYNLVKCYQTISERLDPHLVQHRAKVTVLSSMFGGLKQLLDESPADIAADLSEEEHREDVATRQAEETINNLTPEQEAVVDDALAAVNEHVASALEGYVGDTPEEDVIDDVDPEDEEFIFQADMQDQANELHTAAASEAGVEEEPLASLPGSPALPRPAAAAAPAPAPPTLKKTTRMVTKLVRRPKTRPGGTGVLDQ